MWRERGSPIVTDGRHHHGGLFWGIVITVIGVIFLLDQMEIVHAAWVFEVFWPVILIALGMSIILRTNDFRGNAVPNSNETSNPGQPNGPQVPDPLPHARRATINLWGPVLIFIGALSLLSNLTHVDIGRLWPLWLIGVGAWLLMNRDEFGRPQRHGAAARDWWDRHGRYRDGAPPPPCPPPPNAPGPPAGTPAAATSPGGPSAAFAGPGYAGPGYPPPADSVDDTFYRTVVFMGFNRRITSQHFRFGKVSAVFGGFNLDFRGAEMEGDQAVLQIEAVFGGGEIRIPPTWRVSVTAHEVAGAIVDETYARPGAVAPAKVLIIHGTTVFGGVVIKN
jgi:LiaI-LiaF-like transmembrane region